MEVVPEPDVPEIGAVTPEAKMKKANDGVRSTLPRVRVYVVYRVVQDAGRVGERVYEQFQTRQIVGETNDHGTRKDDSGGSSADTDVGVCGDSGRSFLARFGDPRFRPLSTSVFLP